MRSEYSPHASAMTTSDGRLRPKQDVLATSDGDQMVLLDVGTGEYYTLNAVGGRIWMLLKDGHSLRAIVDQLAHEFDAPQDLIEADTLALVTMLLSMSLLERKTD